GGGGGDQDPRHEDQSDPVPGDAPADRWGSAVDRVVVLGGAEVRRFETEHDEEKGEAEGDQRPERRQPAVQAVSPRPSAASPGRPPAGSRPSPPASSAACLPSASRAASACG